MATEPTLTDSKNKWLSPIESRQERANYYFDEILKKQREWYSNKAGGQKRRHLFFAITVILLGTAISCLQVLDTADALIRYLTAGLGAAVSVLRALDTLLRPEETWQGYRKASEGMKREYRLYINNADAYTDSPDEDAAYRLLVVRVETIVAEEQQLFWQMHANKLEPETVAIPDSEPENSNMSNTATE